VFTLNINIYLYFCLAVDRVKWFRERANRDRYREETEILEADFERTVLSHSRMAEVWTTMADRCTDNPGAAAYARKKVVMYRNLSNEAAKLYADAKTDAAKADVQERRFSKLPLSAAYTRRLPSKRHQYL
jgi:hypothetical protein